MSSAPRRVVITGTGVISPLGSTKSDLWEVLSTGGSGVGPLTVVPHEAVPMRFAAEADQFNGKIDQFGPLTKDQKKALRKSLKVMCRECLMGVAAAQLALSDARLDPSKTEPTRTGITFGADYMLTVPDEFIDGIRKSLDEDGRFEFSRWATDGMPQMSPLWLLKYLPNMPASHLAIYNDFRGPNNSLTLREASANAALGEAYQTILRGSAEAMLVGATGTRIHPMKMIHSIQQEELASGDGDPAAASRPFDLNRTGMVLGEGAGAVVLEELETAKARDAEIYGEVVGSATGSAVGRHMAAQRNQAMTNVFRSVLRSAAAKPGDVGHVHAHGLGTRTCDIEEAAAIQEVFADRAKPVPVVAAKSAMGNLGAGSGMVELIASLTALQHDRLFPVLNYETPDPECPVAVVTDDQTSAGGSFININVTPQGQAAAVMVKAFV